MELNKNTRVLFDSVSHSYLLDGKKLIIGVTELMKKHNLAPDYGDVPEAILRKAAEEGTAIHQEIEAYDDGESLFASELIDQYKKLCEERGLKSLASEYLVSDNELVASSIDKVYETKNGVYLVDIKTTLKYHRRALEVQLGIYKVLFEKANPDIPVIGCGCLWIDKKTKSIKDLIPVTPMTAEEVGELLNAEREGRTYIDTNDTPDLGEVLAPEEADALVANASKIAELEKALKTLKDADTAIRQKLLDYMTENNIAEIACPGGSFKVKAGYTRTGVDSRKLKELYPAILSRVETTTTVKPSLTFNPNK